MDHRSSIGLRQFQKGLQVSRSAKPGGVSPGLRVVNEKSFSPDTSSSYDGQIDSSLQQCENPIPVRNS